jgi:alkylated DNA repair dioxygenase AlkB
MEIHSYKEEDDNYSVFVLIPNFLTLEEQELYFQHLKNIDDWKSGEIAGIEIQRLQKWYQDNGEYFSKHWTNQTHQRWTSHESEEWVLNLRKKVQEKVNELYENVSYSGCNRPNINSTLINYYRNGNDFIKYHTDDEKIFGDNPTIAMLTFGCERSLKFKRNNRNKEMNKAFKIKAGTLFMMMGSVQKNYTHGIDKENGIDDARFSITFREHKS